MKHKLIITALTSAFLFSGCSPAIYIDNAIASYEKVSYKVSLGDSKQKALDILLPSQKDLPNEFKKQSEHYVKDGKNYDIYYMRSVRQADGLKTDDEFTPYIFENGKLIAIGWAYFGGAKTQGQAQDNTTVIIN